MVPVSVLISIGTKSCQQMHGALLVMKGAHKKGKNVRRNEKKD